MKKAFFYAFALCVAASLVACGNKKVEDTTIITTITKDSVRTTPIPLGDTETSMDFDWKGEECTSLVTCTADNQLPVVHDEAGNAYFDNKINLKVTSPSREIYNRTFTKGDFASHIDSNYLPSGKTCMLGIAFVRVEEGKALFVASVGSPDPVSDEYMLVQIALSKDGTISMSKAVEDEI